MFLTDQVLHEVLAHPFFRGYYNMLFADNVKKRQLPILLFIDLKRIGGQLKRGEQIHFEIIQRQK